MNKIVCRIRNVIVASLTIIGVACSASTSVPLYPMTSIPLPSQSVVNGENMCSGLNEDLIPENLPVRYDKFLNAVAYDFFDAGYVDHQGKTWEKETFRLGLWLQGTSEPALEVRLGVGDSTIFQNYSITILQMGRFDGEPAPNRFVCVRIENVTP